MNLLGDITTSPSTNTTPWFTQALNNLTAAAGQYLTLKQQSDLIKLNQTRLEQGYGPLDPDSYAAQVRVGLAPTTLYLIGGGIILGLVLILRKK